MMRLVLDIAAVTAWALMVHVGLRAIRDTRWPPARDANPEGQYPERRGEVAGENPVVTSPGGEQPGTHI